MRLQTVTITAILDDRYSLEEGIKGLLEDQSWISFMDTATINDYDIGEATCEDDLSTARVYEDQDQQNQDQQDQDNEKGKKWF